MATNWIPLLGSAKTAGSKITYIASPIVDGPNAGQQQVAIVKSNITFQSGDITFKVTPTDPNCACQVVLNHGLQPEIFVGLRAGGYAIALFRNGKWEFVSGAGNGDVRVGRTIAIRIRVRGSQIELFIDDVKVASAVESVQESQLAVFLQGPTNFVISDFKVSVQRPKAFVVMQFSEQFDALYEDVIKPTCEKYGFEVVRADDIYKAGLIIQDIVRSIQESAFVIADITPDNPNVFYEVGYAHGIGKTTILLSDRRRDKLPFDVSGFRTLFYDNTIGGKKAVEDSLTKHLDALAT